jgi:hypothetical protein
VTCVACHLEEGKLVGPIEPTGMVAPHPVDVNPDRYRSSSFCSRCHEGTFAQWDAVTMEDKPSCQQCHMTPTIRKITQAKDLLSGIIVAMEKEVHQQRHTFSATPDELPYAPFVVGIDRKGSDVVLSIFNQLPHSVPTGDFGVRIAVVELTTCNANNEVVALGKHELVKELKTAIPAQASRTWTLSLPPDTISIGVKIYRQGRNKSNTAQLFAAEVPLP